MNDYKLIKLNTARNCLRYIIRAFNTEEIYLPYYLCPAVRSAVFKEKCKINYYHIDENFRPAIEFPLNSYILYPDYFGVCSDIVDVLSKKYKNLIVDNAHSFYSKPKGIASFNSLRKFFPSLIDGAFLYTTKTLNTKIPIDEYSYIPHILSFEEFCKNENRLDNQGIKIISKSTYSGFLTVDFEKAKKYRLEKFEFLHKKYGNSNCLNIKINDNTAPFGYPYLLKSIEDADNTVKKLKSEGVNVYRYWNNLPDNYEEKIFYNSLVVITI